MQTTHSIAIQSPDELEERRRVQGPTLVPHVSASDCKRCSSRKVGYFCYLGSAARAEFEAISTPMRLHEETILFMEGQASASVFVICEGRLKLTRSSRHGKTLLIRITGAGEALGISSALASVPHEATATAMEPVQLRTIPRQAFLAFIQKHGEGSLRAAESMGREYRAVMDDAYRLALSTSIAGRVAHLLLALARENGSAKDAQPEINMALKHEELAFKLGSTRESVTRVLNDLKRAGVLSVKGTRMVLLKKDALVNLL